MTRLQFVLHSLVYHRRIQIAVALGVAAATAVLTGALLVGDSVRGSLRGLTQERLGKIEAILALDRFFRRELVSELSAAPAFQQHYRLALPAILFPQATLERRSDERTVRASSVLVLGCDESFWNLDTSGIRPSRFPADGEVILNASLAAELHAQVGDNVTLRLPSSNQVPADSPLANKNDRIRSRPNLKVIAIVPAKGLGRFNLLAAQNLPLNAFVSLETLQTLLDQPGRVNAMFVGDAVSSPAADSGELSRMLRPTVADFGVTVKQVSQTYQPANQQPVVAFEYFTITTDRMIFDDKMGAVIGQTVRPLGGQPVLTYLANSLDLLAADKRAAVPYSLVTAIDFTDSFQLLGSDQMPIESLADDEIVLNSWTTEDLQAKPGDRIRVSFFEPETTHGDAVERSAEFKLKGTAVLQKPIRPFEKDGPAVFDQRPTAANDPDLTPEVQGVTDQQTIADWDAPFPFDYKRVRDVDDKYWQFYRTTPKAFVSLTAGQKLWGSRFGTVTSFRVPSAGGTTLESLRQSLDVELAKNAQQLGFEFISIKQRQLEASRGTTPFDVLFLALSMFVIASALLMVALLFRLGIEQRATEIGTLLAVGFTRTIAGQIVRCRRILHFGGWGCVRCNGGNWVRPTDAGRLEQLVVGSHFLAVSRVSLDEPQPGSRLRTGSRRGCGHDRLGRTSNAKHFGPQPVGGPSDRYVGICQPWSQTAGARCPLLVFRVRTNAARSSPGGRDPVVSPGNSTGRHAASGCVCRGWRRAAGGAAPLCAAPLRRQGQDARPAWERTGLSLSLAERSAARNPGRSVITVGLMGTATFLIVAMSSFRLAPTEQGVGGFRFIAQSSQPIAADLNKPASRSEFFGSGASLMEGATILGIRLRPGDDASCQNLYQSSQPRVLGVTPQVIEHFDSPQAISFTWGASAAKLPADRANPWRLLANPTANDAPVPAVLDKNTALYSLHLYRGVGEEFEFQYDGRPTRFRVAGLLENSVLQGSLLIGESDFRRLFPTISGYRYFLIGTPEDKAAAVATALEDRFSDEGLDVTPARDVLEQLLAVQNTYLSTFQSLGALGLLLGAFGLATVQLRNVLERRGELALLRAVGYRRRRLAQLVLLENVLLLTAGLNVGVLAALLAVLPHKLWGESAISWLLLRDLALMLAAVFLAGLLSSVLTVRAVLRLPLLATLRGE